MWHVDIVEGKSVQVGDRELIPVARVATYVRRRALVGTNRLACEGQGTVVVRPVAIVERSEAGERRLPIREAHTPVLGLLAVLVIAAPLLVMLAAYLRGEEREGRINGRRD